MRIFLTILRMRDLAATSQTSDRFPSEHRDKASTDENESSDFIRGTNQEIISSSLDLGFAYTPRRTSWSCEIESLRSQP